MATPSKWRLEVTFSVLPAVLALLTGIVAAFTNASDIWRKLEDLFQDPLKAAVFVGYATFVVAILTVVLYLLTRSIERRTFRSTSDMGSEVSSSVEAVEPAQGPHRSPAELAAAERERNFLRIRSAFTRTRRRMTYETERIQRNGLLNLAIGILFSVVALGMLGYPLALQLHFLFEVCAPRFGLVGAPPERPCDDVGGLDAPLCELDGDAADFLDRPADQECLVRRRGSVFLGAVTFAWWRMTAIMAKASMTNETWRWSSP